VSAHFVGLAVDLDLEVDLAQLAHQARVELRDGLRLELEVARAPVARLDHEKMMNEIEVDLERPRTVRDGRRREALRGDIERGRPRVVDPGTAVSRTLPTICNQRWSVA
jgi:hypothetical protein